MKLSKSFKIIKHIRRKGLSRLVFVAFAAMMILITLIAVFQ
jgi:hypothetical protein